MTTHRRWVDEETFSKLAADGCEAAHKDGLALALVRLSLVPAASKDVLADVLQRALRKTDAGAGSAKQCEVLVWDVNREGASFVTERLCRRLLDKGVVAQPAIAMFPEQGTSLEALRLTLSTSNSAPRAKVNAAAAKLDQLIKKVAHSNLSVLIHGETGAGKERIAEQIHAGSPRARGPLVRLNCAALTETLLESELFGHEKGSFTGAVSAKAGLLETATGGSVFLDEVGDLPLATQVKLLRVLENRQVQRVGGLEPRPIDVRFISATHKNLEAEIAKGAYREDFYFRLNGFTLVVPPLRERLHELEPLVHHFLVDGYKALGRKGAIAITGEALDLMRRYHWPGNIRELRNVIESALVMASGGAISPVHLPLDRMKAAEASGGKGSTDPRRERVLQALDACGGNQSDAAKMLAISRRTLFNWMEEMGISGPRRRRE